MKDSTRKAFIGIGNWPPSRLFAAVFILAATVFFLRFPDHLTDPQLRVEDGHVFFMDEAIHGLRSFITPYSGYLHTLQRGIAWAGGWVHPRWAPAWYNWFALAVTAAACARIAVSGIPPAWRFGFVAFFLLQPFCSSQAIHVTNVFWFTAALFPILAIEERPKSRSGIGLTLALAALLGLSGPFGIILAPLFLLRLFTIDRKPYTIALFSIIILTGIVQIAFFLSSYRVDLVAAKELPLAPAEFLILANRFLVHGFFGTFANEHSWPQSAVAIGLTAAFVASCARPAMRRAIERADAFRIGMLALATVLMYASGVAGSYHPWLEALPSGEGQRYYMLPYLFSFWFLAALAATHSLQWIRIAIVTLLAAAALTNFHGNSGTSLTWADDVAKAQRDGVAMLRVVPHGSTSGAIAARGESRYGFARGAELRRILDEDAVVKDILGLTRLSSISGVATWYFLPAKAGDAPALLVYPNTLLTVAIPDGARTVRGKYGYAPIAVPPESADAIAGGDGFRFTAYLLSGSNLGNVVYEDFVHPMPVTDPPELKSFSFNIPPGNWKSIAFQNWKGASEEHHTVYDFVLWADFAFESE